MPFEFERLKIPAIVLIKPKRFSDSRGFFMETYKRSDFVTQGIEEAFVQSNFSRSTCGVLRGLHYQKAPQAQGKLVGVLRGEVLDVAVDIRRGSPTYGRWVSQRLSEENGYMLYVPPGFAHGFCVLSAEADFNYMVTAEYAPELDRGIIWNDPIIGVEWPIEAPLLTDKDAQWPLLEEADVNFVYQ
jgi:dTDP-4-dehydrorhamnose 3,5-epimerase